MGGVPDDGAGAERISPWGGEKAHRQTAAVGSDGKWHYPSLEGAMKEAGLTDIRTSIQRGHNMVAQYIAMKPLLDLCEGARQREGVRVTLRWWEQLGIDWEKAKAKETETELMSVSE